MVLKLYVSGRGKGGQRAQDRALPTPLISKSRRGPAAAKVGVLTRTPHCVCVHSCWTTFVFNTVPLFLNPSHFFPSSSRDPKGGLAKDDVGLICEVFVYTVGLCSILGSSRSHRFFSTRVAARVILTRGPQSPFCFCPKKCPNFFDTYPLDDFLRGQIGACELGAAALLWGGGARSPIKPTRLAPPRSG